MADVSSVCTPETGVGVTAVQVPHPDTQCRDAYYAGCSHSKSKGGAKAPLPVPPPAPHQQSAPPPGVVIHTATMADLEAAASHSYVKGVSYDRGAHPLLDDMARWLSDEPEDTSGHFAKETLCVTGPQASAGPDELREACDRLVAKLPEGAIRDAVRRDAEDLAGLLMRQCPEAPKLALQIELTGRNRCSRWHMDYYVGRAIITYVGPSTWMVDDTSVCFDQFDATLGSCWEVSDPLIVPSYDSIHMPASNAVVLMKGNLWPNIAGHGARKGLVHKAPNVITDAHGKVRTRFILKVDIDHDK